MKLDKETFKTLIKESIQEMIEDGAFDYIADSVLEAVAVAVGTDSEPSSDAPMDEALQIKHKEKKIRKPAPQEELNEDFEEEENYSNEDNEDDQIKTLTENAISGFQGKQKDMFKKIFEHTARTTLKQQSQANLPPTLQRGNENGLSAEQQIEQFEKLTSADSSRWSKLAFGKK
jgi:hypothetical protein